MASTPEKQTHWPAWAAHLSILIPGVGFVVPLVLWFWKRTDDPMQRFQILQAFVYQMFQIIFWQVVLLFEGVLLMLVYSLNRMVHVHSITEQVVMKQSLVIAAAVFVGLNLVYIGAALWAALMVGLDKTWTYPWIGPKILKTLLVNGSVDEDFEVRLVAAMGHFGIFYGLNGLYLPFLTWIVAKETAIKLRFHAMQALVFQGFAQIFLTAMLFLIGIFSSPIFAFLVTIPSHDSTFFVNKTTLIVLLAIVGIMMGVTVLLHPFLAVLATIAGIRLFKNKEYDYPIIGKMIKKRFMSVPA